MSDMPTISRERLSSRLLGVLRLVSPGTPLRQGLERILRAETGALIVLGAPPRVQALFTGGFRIHVPYTAQRLSELAKMDGALVLDEAAHEIWWANVHLMPDPAVPTVETGTRHRTAERVARQTGVPVIAVSESMRTVTLYVDEWRHVVDEVGAVLSRANQAVQTLQHYRARCDEASAALTALELQGRATLRMVVALLWRGEMVRRIGGEVERYVAELGADARLLRLQLDELSAGVEEEQRLTVHDYVRPGRGAEVDDLLEELGRRSLEDLTDVGVMAKTLDLGGNPEALDAMVTPRGYRLLSKVRGLPSSVISRVVERFGSLKVILAASLEDLEEVEGVGPGRARNLREGLARLAEASALEHYA
ncbi:MAG TPA: DNA integrity scanning diadenylate cyclase DisA [Actinomycetes bacterium]|jgi:diadenylate cyclase|nr:DNA integrity scanning diadenylate cyclase DisA [Actinomycetes bacterium]